MISKYGFLTVLVWNWKRVIRLCLFHGEEFLFILTKNETQYPPSQNNHSAWYPPGIGPSHGGFVLMLSWGFPREFTEKSDLLLHTKIFGLCLVILAARCTFVMLSPGVFIDGQLRAH